MSSPIDANAFLDPAAFAETLGTDDTIDLPAGFFERALTQLHAKGYGLLARRAERHEDRYIRRLKRDAWNFDYSDTVTAPRAELGLRDTMAPLGKLFIPAKSVRIGTGGAVAAPTAGKGTWEQLGGYTKAAKVAADRATALEVIKVLDGRAAMPAKIKKCNTILDTAKWHFDSLAELTLAILGGQVEACFLPFEYLATRTVGDLKDWSSLIMRMSWPIGRLAIMQSYALTAECISLSLFNVSLWTNGDFLHEDDTLVVLYTCPGNAEISIILRQNPTTDEWYVYIKGCHIRVETSGAHEYKLDTLLDWTVTDSMEDTTFEFDFDTATEKQKDKFLATLGDHLAEWFGGDFSDVNIDDTAYMPLCVDAMDEASNLYSVEWAWPEVKASDKQTGRYGRMQVLNGYLTHLLADEAGYVVPVAEMLGKLGSRQYDYVAVMDGSDGD